MSVFAHVILRDCNRHIYFIRVITSAVEGRDIENRVADRADETIPPIQTCEIANFPKLVWNRM